MNGSGYQTTPGYPVGEAGCLYGPIPWLRQTPTTDSVVYSAPTAWLCCQVAYYTAKLGRREHVDCTVCRVIDQVSAQAALKSPGPLLRAAFLVDMPHDRLDLRL